MASDKTKEAPYVLDTSHSEHNSAPDLPNVIFITQTKFWAKNIYSKKYVIFCNTKFATKLRKWQNTKKFTQNQ